MEIVTAQILVEVTGVNFSELKRKIARVESVAKRVDGKSTVGAIHSTPFSQNISTLTPSEQQNANQTA